MQKELVKYKVSLTKNDTISISQGNSKIGKIFNLNTLPGTEPVKAKGVTLVNITGTCSAVDCSECGQKCYAVRALQRHYTKCLVPWAKNTLLLRRDLKAVEKQVNGYILYKNVKLFRFHSAGEIETVEQFAMYCRIARANKETRFAVYTKAFDIVSSYILDGGKIPSNFVINLSEWHGNIQTYLEHQPEKIRRAFKRMNVFSYYDGHSDCMQSDKFRFCPAVDSKKHETGIKCDKCQRCYKSGMMTRVRPH